MKKYKTKQLYIEQLEHPFEAVNQIIFENEGFEKFCQNDDFKIKKFLGSDWSIKDSGFIFYGPNDINVVFSLINIEINDFNRINKYIITHINGEKIFDEIIFLFSLIRDTTDNTTILEISMEYTNDTVFNNIDNKISISSIKALYKKTYSKINNIFDDKSINIKKDLLLVNHSFMIKKIIK